MATDWFYYRAISGSGLLARSNSKTSPEQASFNLTPSFGRRGWRNRRRQRS